MTPDPNAAHLAQAVEAVRSGASASYVARTAHLPYERLRAACHAAGVRLTPGGGPLDRPKRQPPPPQHPERDAAIVAAAARGESHKVIAATHGLSRERVRQVVAAAGGPPGLDAVRASRAERLDAMEALYREGLTHGEIARRYNVTEATIARLLHRRGITRPLGKRPQVERNAAIVAAVRAGASYKAAGKPYGIGPMGVFHVIKRSKT